LKKLSKTAVALLLTLSAGTASAQISSTSPAQKACEGPNTNTPSGRLECLDEMIATATKAGDEHAVAIFRTMRIATAYAAQKAEDEAATARARAQHRGPAEVPMCNGRMTRDGCQPR
jgi:hypothetical protein